MALKWDMGSCFRAPGRYRLGMKTVIRAGYGLSADSNNWRFFRTTIQLRPTRIFWAARLFSAAELTGATLAPYRFGQAYLS